MYVHVFVVRFLSFVTIMEEVSLSSEEEVVAVDPKFQRFGASLERALRTFEISREWHDLISALTRLHKVLLAYTQFKVLPHRQLVCKRLAQCLHPQLPSGVHLKSLEVYSAIFNRISREELTANLLTYTSGLLPVLEYASLVVRPSCLCVYEQYLVPIGADLVPVLHGVVMSILPALEEEESEQNDRVIRLLDSISSCSLSSFSSVLWTILHSSPSVRLPASSYLLSHLTKSNTDLAATIVTSLMSDDDDRKDSTRDLAVSSLSAALSDSSTLVLRATLDITSLLFPFHTSSLTLAQNSLLLSSALKCLLKRDVSLNRRLYSWLLGPTVTHTDTQKDTSGKDYFTIHVQKAFTDSVATLLTDAVDSVQTGDRTSSLVPYRLLRSLLDRHEFSYCISSQLCNITACLKEQLDILGIVRSSKKGARLDHRDERSEGEGKKLTKKFQLKNEVVHNGVQLLLAIKGEQLWKWMEEELIEGIHRAVEDDKKLTNTLSLVRFTIELLPLSTVTEPESMYLPSLLITILKQSLTLSSLPALCSCLDFVAQMLQLLSVPYFDKSTTVTHESDSVTSNSTCFTQILVLNQQLISKLTEDHTHITPLQLSVTDNVCREEECGLYHQCYQQACHCMLTSAHMLAAVLGKDGAISLQSGSPHSVQWAESLMMSSLKMRRVALVAVHTLLSVCNLSSVPPLSSPSLPLANGADLVRQNKSFIQAVSQVLWKMLSDDLLPSNPGAGCEEEAAMLLCQLFSVSQFSSTVEEILLEEFAAKSVLSYQRFTILWQFGISCQPDTALFKRSVLRMLEGLQSSSPAVVYCVQTWVKYICHTHQLGHALYPVYQLLADACPPKHSTSALEEQEKVEDMQHAKYYYASLKKPCVDKEKSKVDNSKIEYPSYLLTKHVDVPRFSYAISMLHSVILVDPVGIVTALLSTDSTRDTQHRNTLKTKQSHSSSTTPSSATKDTFSSQPSLMEAILCECVSLILSSYPSWLDVDMADHDRLQEVQTSSTALVVTLLSTCINILNKAGDHEGHSLSDEAHSSLPHPPWTVISTNVLPVSPGYLSTILAHCEIQKACLHSLFHLLSPSDDHQDEKQTSDRQPDSHRHSAYSLYLQLLRLVYCLLVLDSFCYCEEPVKEDIDTTTHSLLPNRRTASQPLFHHLVTLALLAPSLPKHQTAFMALINRSLPLLNHQLHQLAPLALKQVCKNLSAMIKKGVDNRMRAGGCDNQRLVTHVQLLTAIVHYCLLENINQSSSFLYYQLPDPFSNLPFPSTQFRHDSALSKISSSDKQVSTISWLFGGLFGAVGDKEEEIEVEKEKYVGLGSRAGRRVLLMMPFVYRMVSKLWRHCCAGVGDSDRTRVYNDPLSKDMWQLLTLLITPIASYDNSVLYYSSVAQVWMIWNLTGQSKRPLKDSFIQLLHRLKIQSLSDMLVGIEAAILNMSSDGENERVKIERQKHLLHFLYRFLSSPLQCSQSLCSCCDQLVGLLKNAHQMFTVGVQPGFNDNINLLCMLTSILHVLICRVPSPDVKTHKKQRRDLQDVIYKLCDSLAAATPTPPAPLSSSNTSLPPHLLADESVSETSNISSFPPSPSSLKSASLSTENDHVTATTSEAAESTDLVTSSTLAQASSYVTSTSSDRVTASQASSSATDPILITETSVGRDEWAGHGSVPTTPVQALGVLSSVLSHFVDCGYEAAEKDRIHSLLRTVLKHVWPVLRCYCPTTADSYHHAVHLLSSLTSFQVTRRCWKDEALDIFLAHRFFVMDPNSIHEWRVIIDNLMCQDKTMFRSLLNRLSSPSSTGVVNLFSSLEQERQQRGRLLKRVSFVLVSGEANQYSSYLPEITEKLQDSLRWFPSYTVRQEVLQTFRVLLICLNSTHLTSIWPSLLSELSSVLSELEGTITQDHSNLLTKEKLSCYFSACKLLSTAISFPPSLLPHFQLMKQGFIGVENNSVVDRMLKLWEQQQPKVSQCSARNAASLRELMNYLRTLLHTTSTNSKRRDEVMRSIEENILKDFVEQ